MTIDFSKPLECDIGLKVLKIQALGSGDCLIRMKIQVEGVFIPGDVTYWVSERGIPLFKHMPASFTVRNKKSVEEKAIDVAINRLKEPHAATNTMIARAIVCAIKEANLLAEDK